MIRMPAAMFVLGSILGATACDKKPSAPSAPEAASEPAPIQPATPPEPASGAATAPDAAAPAAADAAGSAQPAPVEAWEGPTLSLEGGAVSSKGFPAISHDGATVAFIRGNQERDPDELVLWTIASDARRSVPLHPNSRPAEPSDEATLKAQLEARQAAVASARELVAATKWAPLAEVGSIEGLAVAVESASLVVRENGNAVSTESHPEWLVESQPPCPAEAVAGAACGCEFRLRLDQAWVAPTFGVLLARVAYASSDACGSGAPAGFMHLTRYGAAKTAAAAGEFAAPAPTIAATVAWSCANDKRIPNELSELERAFVSARRSQLRDALARPMGQKAVWDALEACEPAAAAPPAEPAPTWKDALQESKYALGFSADGKTFVAGTVECNRLDLWKETITAGAIGPQVKGKKIAGDAADARAPPLPPLPFRLLDLDPDEMADRAVLYRMPALSFLAVTRCDRRPGSPPPEPDVPPELDCTLRVEVRAPNSPAGVLLAEPVESLEWEARRFEIYARPEVSAIGVALVRGGDHGCGDFELSSYAVPRDIAAAVNKHALLDLQAGRLSRAREAFSAALAIDPAGALPRYNLACTLARLQLPADTAATLAPLAGADAPERATWLAKINADKDFDPVRESAELRALLAAP